MELYVGLMIFLMIVFMVVIFQRNAEAFTVEERVHILEKRVDALYSGGADARHLPVFSSANQH